MSTRDQDPFAEIKLEEARRSRLVEIVLPAAPERVPNYNYDAGYKSGRTAALREVLEEIDRELLEANRLYNREGAGYLQKLRAAVVAMEVKDGK